MNLLLDTHAVLWWLRGARMTAAARAAIADRDNLVTVSAASVWEIAIKRAAGKLRVKGPIVEYIEAEDFEPLSITNRHAERAGGLPQHHRDPFDRMLIAQAQLHGLTIVTRDPSFDDYDVAILAC